MGAEGDGVAAVVLPAHDNHAVVFLVDQVVGQRQIVSDDLHRFAAQFTPQQKGGGAAVDDDALTRRDQLRSGARNTHFFIQILRLVDIHRRPAGALLANGFRAIAYLFQFAAFIQLVDITSGRCG